MCIVSLTASPAACHGLAGSGGRRDAMSGTASARRSPGGVGVMTECSGDRLDTGSRQQGWIHLHRATASRAGRGLWSSWAPLLCQDLLWCRAILIPTGLALVIGHALEPLPCATLGAGRQRGTV